MSIPGEKRRYFYIGFTLLLFLITLGYSYYSSNSMINKYTPLVDATMEIKLHAATAHLWLEEILSGDRNENIEKVINHIDEATWYANVMLDGGQNHEGTFIPLKDKKLREEVDKTLRDLDEFKKISQQRYQTIETSGTGTEIDQHFDKLFNSFTTQIDYVETLLQQKIREDFGRYQLIQLLLICALAIVGLITLYTQYRYNQEKEEAVQAIQNGLARAEESENWLKTTMNSMGDGVIITDHQGLVTYLNPVASSLTGWRINDAKHKKLTEVFNIVNEFTKEPVQDPVEMVIRKNVIVGLANHTELIAKDGTVWPIADSAAPIYDHDKNLLGVVLVFHEISAQKKAETEKALLESQLRQAFKMEAIGTMAGGIAHDFNNVLAIILGNADMARDDIPETNPARHNIDQVLVAANRAKNLVRQILSFSRKEEVKKESLNLVQLIKETVDSLRSTIPSSVDLNLTIQDNADNDVTENQMVLADPTQIHQLLMNLCVNGVQAMNEKGKLDIELAKVSFADNIPPERASMKPGTYILLSVSDTGSGISEDVIEQIFDPFFTTKEVGEGTGMGLSVVHGIVEEHGGKIFVESEFGTGTIFHVYFPVSTQTPEHSLRETAERPVGNERILFVDDEEMLADMGKELIERQGYTVTVKTDSVAALDLFNERPDQFDLVITDQTMPKMTGVELAEQILRIRPELPIILCSGYSSKVDKKSAEQIGIREFASKPLDRDKIALLIRKVLDEKHPS